MANLITDLTTGLLSRISVYKFTTQGFPSTHSSLKNGLNLSHRYRLMNNGIASICHLFTFATTIAVTPSREIQISTTNKNRN